MPFNVAFFAYLEDDGRHYLARSWLASTDESGGATAAPRARAGKRAEWNGIDWFVSFGDSDGCSWEDGLRYSFVSARGDAWYSHTLRSLPVGARVNVHIPKQGYVAVGETLGPAQRFDAATVPVGDDWVALRDQDLVGICRYVPAGVPETDDNPEWVVPVRWNDARPREAALWKKGCSPTRTVPAS